MLESILRFDLTFEGYCKETKSEACQVDLAELPELIHRFRYSGLISDNV